MQRKITILISTALVAGLMSGCSTIKMPNLDFIKLPEFKKDAENIDKYPKVSEAQPLPENIRSDASWDKAAKKIIKARNGFSVPVDNESAKTDAEIIQEMKDLAAKIDDYKLDDPQ